MIRSYRPATAVAATGLAVALSLFGDMAMYVILPAQNTVLGFSAIQVGLLLSVNRWIRLVTNQMARRLLRRWGTAIPFPTALGIGSLLAVGYAMIPSFAVLLMLRIVWGACWSIIRHTGVMTANDAAEPNRRGRSMGIYFSLINVGFVAGTFAAGWFYDWGGYQRAFLLAGALSLAALPAAFVGRRSRSIGSRSLHKTAADSAEARSMFFGVPFAASETEIPADEDPGETGKLSFSMTARGFIVSFVGTGLIMSTLGYTLNERYGEVIVLGRLTIGVTALTGILLSVRSLINFVGSPVAGGLIDRIGHKRALWIGYTVGGAALLAAGVFGRSAAMIPMIVVFFAGSMVARLAVESRAAGLGHRPYAALATSTDLGSAIGPMLGWLGIELTRSTSVFLVGGVLLLAAAFLRDRSSS